MPTERKPGAETTARLQVVAAALLFSTGGVVVKATALDSWQVACGRSLIAVVLFPFVLGLRRAGIHWGSLLAAGFYAATMISFVTANKLTTAANSIFLQYTAPLYVVVLAPILLKEEWRRVDGAVAALMVCGLACFGLGVDPVFDSAPNPLLGNVVGALSGVFWAGTLLSIRWLTTTDATAVPAAVVIGNLLTVLAGLPFVFPVEAGSTDLLAVGYLGVFQIVVAYVFMLAGMRVVPAFEASTLMMLEPVASSMLAWFIYAERPGVLSLVGSAVILVATVLRSDRFRARSSDLTRR